VYDEGDYVHCAYVTVPGGGKIIVMSEAMAALFLGSASGVRFKAPLWWGKDSKIFMQEIFAFFLSD
jgi:hypothetical protein